MVDGVKVTFPCGPARVAEHEGEGDARNDLQRVASGFRLRREGFPGAKIIFQHVRAEVAVVAEGAHGVGVHEGVLERGVVEPRPFPPRLVGRQEEVEAGAEADLEHAGRLPLR